MKKVISLILVLTLCLMMAPTTKVKAAETMSMLHTEGNKIVNAEGEQITLRGTNLGGWLMQEGWLSPLGNGEIDHAYITEIIASCSNGDHTAEKAFDTITQDGIKTNNMATYWQSDKAQDNDNMELKIVLDKARTFNSMNNALPHIRSLVEAKFTGLADEVDLEDFEPETALPSGMKQLNPFAAKRKAKELFEECSEELKRKMNGNYARWSRTTLSPEIGKAIAEAAKNVEQDAAGIADQLQEVTDVAFGEGKESTMLWIDHHKRECCDNMFGEYIVGKSIAEWLGKKVESYQAWRGFLPEIVSECNDDELNITFHGTKNDYDLFCGHLNEQAESLAEDWDWPDDEW